MVSSEYISRFSFLHAQQLQLDIGWLLQNRRVHVLQQRPPDRYGCLDQGQKDFTRFLKRMAAGKITLYFVGFGTFTYALMKIVVPDEEKLRKELPEGQPYYRDEALKKRQAIVDVLSGAAGSQEPMYRQTKEQIDASRDQFLTGPKKS